jgi:hypothetical protein
VQTKGPIPRRWGPSGSRGFYLPRVTSGRPTRAGRRGRHCGKAVSVHGEHITDQDIDSQRFLSSRTGPVFAGSICRHDVRLWRTPPDPRDCRGRRRSASRCKISNIGFFQLWLLAWSYRLSGLEPPTVTEPWGRERLHGAASRPVARAGSPEYEGQRTGQIQNATPTSAMNAPLRTSPYFSNEPSRTRSRPAVE